MSFELSVLSWARTRKGAITDRGPDGLGFVPKFALRWVMFLAVRTLALRKIVVFVVVNATVVVDV